eukprot:scaffold20834_cov59-Phaeocystis_antarctica.AAC.2
MAGATLTVAVAQHPVLEAAGQRGDAGARLVLLEELLAEGVRAGEHRGEAEAAGEHEEGGPHCRAKVRRKTALPRGRCAGYFDFW